MEIPEKTNKAMDPGESVNKTVEATTVKAVSLLENEYFFPASNGYKAISIRAATKADADAIYRERREPEEKVDDSTQTNNQK